MSRPSLEEYINASFLLKGAKQPITQENIELTLSWEKMYSTNTGKMNPVTLITAQPAQSIADDVFTDFSSGDTVSGNMVEVHAYVTFRHGKTNHYGICTFENGVRDKKLSSEDFQIHPLAILAKQMYENSPHMFRNKASINPIAKAQLHIIKNNSADRVISYFLLGSTIKNGGAPLSKKNFKQRNKSGIYNRHDPHVKWGTHGERFSNKSSKEKGEIGENIYRYNNPNCKWPNKNRESYGGHDFLDAENFSHDIKTTGHTRYFINKEKFAESVADVWVFLFINDSPDASGDRTRFAYSYYHITKNQLETMIKSGELKSAKQNNDLGFYIEENQLVNS